MIQSVETEIVKAHTRLDGVDARLKKIEKQLNKLLWINGSFCGAISLSAAILAVVLGYSS